MAPKRIEGLLPHPVELIQIGLNDFIETFSENEFGVSLMSEQWSAEEASRIYHLVLRQDTQVVLGILEIEQLPFGQTLFTIMPPSLLQAPFPTALHAQAYQTFTQALLLYVKAIGFTLFHSKPDPDQGLGLSAEEPSHEK